MRTCDLLVTTKKGQLIAGTIVLDGSHVFAVPAEGYETLVKNVLEAPVVTPRGKFYRESTPVNWFEGLPLQYRGSYLQAKLS